MNKDNLFIKKINTLLKILLSLLKNINHFFHVKYFEILFIKDKQKTIKNIYDPLILDKLSTEKSLKQELLPLIKDNNHLMQEIKKETYENLKLKEKITIIQSLLVNTTNLK